MVNSMKSRMQEEDGDPYDELVAKHESNSYKAVGNSSEQKSNTLRSKHSETEQRRRSKINERFQALRDLIPQNDQKRDKASFLLEVIEYIQFLNQKLQMYEESYPGWSEEPTKLVPWRNCHIPVENFMNHSQVINNASGLEVSQADTLTDAKYKVMDCPPGSAIQTTPLSMQDFVSDGENMVSQVQSQSLESRVIEQDLTVESNCAAPNNMLYEQDEIACGAVSVSTVHSQGILNSLTQAMQSAGVDLSKANISVQLDVRKRSTSAPTPSSASSKEQEKLSPNNQAIAIGVDDLKVSSEHAHKRPRTERI